MPKSSKKLADAPTEEASRTLVQGSVRILSKKQIKEIVRATDPTLNDWVKLGIFPAPIELGPNKIGWLEHEIYDWVITRKRRVLKPTPSQVERFKNSKIKAA